MNKKEEILYNRIFELSDRLTKLSNELKDLDYEVILLLTNFEDYTEKR